MKVIQAFSELAEVQETITYALGTFDGLHRGHRAVIQEAVRRAKAVGGKSVVLTFDKHPLSLLRPGEEPPALLQDEEKRAILASWDVDYLLVLPLTEGLLRMEAREFVAELLSPPDVGVLVMGDNYTFGRLGLGTPDLLKQFCEPKGIDVDVVPLCELEGLDAPISSTVIRQAVQRGDMELVESLLGRPYSFRGTVISGDQRGRTLGYPTLNFLFPKEMASPADGVYVNRVFIKGRWYDGVGNMGDNPTFENQYHRCEVHILDFDDDIYGESVVVSFLAFLRGEVKFTSLEGLVEQLHRDEDMARAFLKQYKGGPLHGSTLF